jgi:alanyl-tRNA synthetase
MTGAEIRRRFLHYFQRRDHLVLDSASLVPTDDPTTLFISAGMQPLQPYYLGMRQPPSPRLASCQKCLRIGDLEQVGRTDRHHTFFEMLGNFAPTGAYFKERAIPWAWELVTEGFGLASDRLRVTVHPTDEAAREVWSRETGVDPAWIYDSPSNWWGLETGPCGPDSELWWDRGREVGCGRDDCYPDHCDRFLEIWNLVFPQFDRQPDGSLPPMPKPGIDTGMGFERMATVIQGVDSNFDIDVFAPILDFIRESAGQSGRTSERVIADHLRAMTFVIGDGVRPANEGRGYVLRRVIRRASLHARRLGLRRPLSDGVPVVVGVMKEQYPYLVERESAIREAVAAEQESFNRTLERGMELFEQIAARHRIEIPGGEAFRLHDTFGFPLELTRELAQERGLAVDEAGFAAAMEEQRSRSRGAAVRRWADLKSLPSSEFVGYDRLTAEATVLGLRRGGGEAQEASEGDEVEVYLDVSPFYAESGGQIGDVGTITGSVGEVQVDDTQRPFQGVIAHLGRVRVGRLRVGDGVRASVDGRRRRQIMRHHTATHLLNKALEEVLGRRNLQRGSWVGPDRTTFDFPLERALSAGELERVQRRINEQVRAALPFHARILPYDQAVATGATHLFDEKYGDLVRVVCFGDWSCEFCGGTHCGTSADVGFALITSESSVGQGLRRIDMTVGESAEALVRRRLGELSRLSRELGVAPEQLGDRTAELRRELREAQRRIKELQDERRSLTLELRSLRDARGPVSTATMPSRRQTGVPLVLEQVPADSMNDLRGWADRYLEKMGGHGVVGVANDANFVIKVSRDLADRHPANELASHLGKGGGRAQLAQGSLDRSRPLDAAFEDLEAALR